MRQDEREIRYLTQDESRFGLKTFIGRVITACGIKPIGTWQWLFKACLWQYLKADLKWAAFKTLDQRQAKVDQLLTLLTPALIASITGYEFILNALSALDTV